MIKNRIIIARKQIFLNLRLQHNTSDLNAFIQIRTIQPCRDKWVMAIFQKKKKMSSVMARNRLRCLSPTRNTGAVYRR